MDELEFFLNQLKDEDFSVRLNAIHMLGEFQDSRAVKPLLELFSDPEWQIRSAAIEAISNIKDKTIVETIANFLRADDANLRNAAMQALEKMGEDVIDPLCKNLKDNDSDVRIFAANTLGNIRDKKAVPALIEALNDSDENVFYAVVEALGRIGDKQALHDLLTKLNEKDIWDRFVIITTLGSIGDETILPELIKQLEHEELKAVVIEALSNIGYEGTLGIIIDMINKEEDFDIKLEALKALFNISLKSYEYAKIERNSYIHDFLLENLNKIDFIKLEPFIIEIFDSGNNDIKDKILQILNWANVKFPLTPIIELLKIEELENQAYELLIKQNELSFTEIEKVLEKESDIKIKAKIIKSLGYNPNIEINEFVENLLDSEIPEYVVAASEALLLQLVDLNAKEDLIAKLFELIGNGNEDIKYSAKSLLIVMAHSEYVISRLEKIIKTGDYKLLKEAIEIASISNNFELIDDIINYIDSSEPGIRREVFQTINYLAKIDINRDKILNHPKVNKIYDGLYDKDDSVKIEAIMALGSLKTDKAFDILKSALFDSTFNYFKHYIVRALKEFLDKNQLLDVFIKLLEIGADAETKLVVINAFREFGDPKPIEFLSDMLFEEFEDDIKAEILLTIGELGGIEEIDYILPFIEEDNWFLKNSAVNALSKIVNEEVEQSLIELVKSLDKAEDTIIIKSCINALKNYTDEEVAGLIMDYISDENYSFVAYEAMLEILSKNNNLAEYVLNKAIKSDNIRILRLIVSIFRELKLLNVKDKLVNILNNTNIESIKFSIMHYLLSIDEPIAGYCNNCKKENNLITFFCKKTIGV